MTQLPKTTQPLVVRTDFSNQPAWEAVRAAIQAPVYDLGQGPFYAHVDFLEDIAFENLTVPDLLSRVPKDNDQPALFVVDQIALSASAFPVLVVDLGRFEQYGRSFRAVAGQIQAIENNLSISNMDFFEFADNVDPDGIFRGFQRPR